MSWMLRAAAALVGLSAILIFGSAGILARSSTQNPVVEISGADSTDQLPLGAPPAELDPIAGTAPLARPRTFAAESGVYLTMAPLPSEASTVIGDEPFFRPRSRWAESSVLLSLEKPGLLDAVAGLEPGLRIRTNGAEGSRLISLVKPIIDDGVIPPIPDVVSDLSAEPLDTLGSFELKWTAPGPERAVFYDIRYSSNPISEGTWDSAIPIPGTPPNPSLPGKVEVMTISGLPTGPLDARYYFALKSSDGLGGFSPLSVAPETVTCKRAVVLVHGWRSSADGAWGNSGFDFAKELENEGFCVYNSLNLDPNNGNIGDNIQGNNDLAEQLKAAVNDLHIQDYPGVDLVTHSMGGLVARTYARYHASTPDLIGNIIMLGTPNHGTNLFTLALSTCLAATKGGPLAVTACLAGWEAFKGEAGRQMEATVSLLFGFIAGESPFLRSLNGSEPIEGINYWTIAGTDARSGPLETKWTIATSPFVVPNPDDGLVSEASVCLSGSNSHYRFEVNHPSLHESEEVKNLVASILKGQSPSGVSCKPLVKAQAGIGAQQQSTPPLPQVALSVSGELLPGDEKRVPLTVEQGILTIEAIALVSDASITFSLQTPSGVIDSASDFYAEDVEGLLKTYDLTDPEPGGWELVLSLPELASAPANYQLSGILQGGVVLLMDMPESITIPGEMIQINANLAAEETPIPGAEVVAHITGPDGKTSIVPLTDNDDGSYDLTYLPSDSGRFEVRIDVAGVFQNAAFMRQSTVVFWVVEGAPLQGTLALEGRSQHSGAQILIEPEGLITTSAGDGSFAFLRVPEGSHEIIMSAPGYGTEVLKYDVISSVDAQVLPPINLQPNIRGDCNGDDIVGAPDITAVVLEIFDGDGTAPTDASQGSFAGTTGCDANEDGQINAADITAAVLLIFSN